MNKEDFLKEQYVSLREEIRETKDRIFKIVAIALFVLPGGQYLARTIESPEIVLVLPLLVISTAFLYLAENRALMRCGRFIKNHIETEIPSCTAWEKWLEDKKDIGHKRSVDKFVSYSIYLVLFAYYIASVSAAWKQSSMLYGDGTANGMGVIYAGIGMWSITFLIRNVTLSTTTADDHTETKQDREAA